jgi:hypothetical protein
MTVKIISFQQKQTFKYYYKSRQIQEKTVKENYKMLLKGVDHKIYSNILTKMDSSMSR